MSVNCKLCLQGLLCRWLNNFNKFMAWTTIDYAISNKRNVSHPAFTLYECLGRRVWGLRIFKPSSSPKHLQSSPKPKFFRSGRSAQVQRKHNWNEDFQAPEAWRNHD